MSFGQGYCHVDSLVTSPVTTPAVLGSTVEIRVVTSEERVALVSLWMAKKDNSWSALRMVWWITGPTHS